MKNITTHLISILSFFVLLNSTSFGQSNSKHTYVKAHYRKDGTYVKGYYKTMPNGTNRDNFSTKGNLNPYTGQYGWINPDNRTNTPYIPHSNSNYSVNYTESINSLGQKVIVNSSGKEIFSLCTYCNDFTYKNNIEYYWYSPTSGIQKTMGFSNGILLDGEYKYYNTEGILQIKAFYLQGVLHGEYIVWNENGNIKEKFYYTLGVLDNEKLNQFNK